MPQGFYLLFLHALKRTTSKKSDLLQWVKGRKKSIEVIGVLLGMEANDLKCVTIDTDTNVFIVKAL